VVIVPAVVTSADATMRAVSPNYFDDDVASRYDDDDSMAFDAVEIENTVTLLAELAGSGDALEFGVGTGRIALPLTARGVKVTGIDLSIAMVDRLRAKAGGSDVDVAIGDFASTTLALKFSLVYLVFNTIMNVTTQSAQTDCFRNAARHLEPGGRFLVECLVPDLQRLPHGERIRPFTVTPSRLGFDEYDVVGQGVVSHHLWRDGEAWKASSVPFRYAWPAELDLMAELAGLTLEHRWSGWNEEPFTERSARHVSVWTLAEGGPARPALATGLASQG
jgi:SAM-dependent methyltransferase